MFEYDERPHQNGGITWVLQDTERSSIADVLDIEGRAALDTSSHIIYEAVDPDYEPGPRSKL
ncbi:hypothetical protein TWF696_003365 [Orbilia brochopaga]|uniref:Uncharacterized protein n=1 Tax=Orbilia brochopaga TaxID=3140254 RepID=A0AAV9TY45_9PEZI